jgi:hypothetical protein
MERILKFYKIYQRLSKLSFSWGALIWAGGIFAFFFLRTSPVWYGLSFPFFFLGIIQMGGAFRDYFSADERIRFMQRIESPSLVELKSSEKNFAEDVLRQGKNQPPGQTLTFCFWNFIMYFRCSRKMGRILDRLGFWHKSPERRHANL